MTQRERVFNMLRDAGSDGVSSNDFFRACLPRFSARVHELRNAGHTITKEPVEQGHFLYRLVKVSAAPTSVDRESLDDRGADLGQSPNTPERQRNRQVADVAGESSTDLGAANSPSSPQAETMAVSEPDAGAESTDATGQITDAPESRDGSGALLLFEIPVNRWADAA
jgi:hypothetical protein